jgi:inner membrane protein
VISDLVIYWALYRNIVLYATIYGAKDIYTMFVFGHAGITLGSAIAISSLISFIGNAGSQKYGGVNTPADNTEYVPASYAIDSSGNHNPLLDNRIDARVLLIGSMLPDIIDKPLGLIIFPQEIANGRIFCHSLFFLILITIVGLLILCNRGKFWLLTLAFGVSMHLILDQMWMMPRTFLWPLLGVTFDKTNVDHWLSDWINQFLTQPSVYISEILGALIAGSLLVVLLGRKKLWLFILTGRLD